MSEPEGSREGKSVSKPWENEPDQKGWEAHGLPCAIRRNECRGHLCGYVGVPKTHPLHGVSYREPEVDVHGGLTYSEIKADARLPKGYWWFGFDCDHGGDLAPRAVEKYPALGNERDIYRDFAYVTKETERLAKQLAAWGAEDE
jgi:hypothetical protein